MSIPAKNECTCQPRGFAWSLDAVARLTAFLNVVAPRWLLRSALWLVLGLRDLATSEGLQGVWRQQFTCDSEVLDTHGAFLKSFHDQVLGSGAFERLAGYVEREGRWWLACRLEAFVRLAALARLRHWLIARRPGPPPLAEVHLACCVECDQSCQGCYSACDRRGAMPDAARLGELMDEAARSGAAVIHLIGKGEPLLDDARGLALLGAIHARPHLFFTVATSAVHLTPTLAAAAARSTNLLVLVSIDGFQAVHDARRGAGTWARVQEALRLLREARALYGFSATVTRTNWSEAASQPFVADLRRAGCCLGVYSRYFSTEPLPEPSPFRLAPAELVSYRAALEVARRDAGMPLIDLDELEAFTGCRARAGLSVYVDGATGQVSPCIRLPWSPASCRLDGAPRGQLDRVLALPFFSEYRGGKCAQGCWCGEDLAAEQDALRAKVKSFERS